MENTNIIRKSKKRILIVEDEKAMAMAVQIKLQKAGIDAHAVFSGDEGLAELEKNEYSLVLLDIMMPGKDGWEVLSTIREKGINTKVIITSNLSLEENNKKARQLGAVDFLVKSDTSLSMIVEEVKSFLQ